MQPGLLGHPELGGTDIDGRCNQIIYVLNAPLGEYGSNQEHASVITHDLYIEDHSPESCSLCGFSEADHGAVFREDV